MSTMKIFSRGMGVAVLSAFAACGDADDPGGQGSSHAPLTDAGTRDDDGATGDGGPANLGDASMNEEDASIGRGPTGVAHGAELTIDQVGPWAVQRKVRGAEVLDEPARPAAGFFRLANWKEEGLLPDKAFVGSDSDLEHLNDPANKGGRLDADTMIDGFLIPAGTYVIQFRVLAPIYAQSLAKGDYLFRGDRFHNTGDTFNTAYSSGGFHIYIHYCDFGGDGPDDAQDGGGFLHILGGANHRVLRSNFEYVATAIQPNVNGMLIQENLIDHVAYYFSDRGPDGNPGTNDNYHINGISSEGGLSSLRILRNKILVPSPDGAVAPSFDAPNRTVPQTDCIALFQSLGGPYPGDETTGIQVRDNYLGGSGYVIYGGGEGSKNVKITGNRISTKFWTNGGNFGPFAYAPSSGNGNEVSNNTWADDYGTGGNGINPTSARQYPAGDGPRRGTKAF